MNWKPLNKNSDLPRDKSFLIWDSKKQLGCSVYEAVVLEGEIINLSATHYLFEGPRYTHWCEISAPGELQYEPEDVAPKPDKTDLAARILREVFK